MLGLRKGLDMENQEILARQAEEALRQSREQLRLLIDGAKDYAIIMLDANGCVSSWNEGARRVKGWQEEEITGRHFSLFYPEELVAAGQPELELNSAAAKGRYAAEAWRMRKDGSMFMADVIITAIRDQQGGLRGFSKVTRDITERKRAEAYGEMAREVLQILNEPGSLDDLISRVLGALKRQTGFDAVGMRLQDGDDFPYFAQQGFSLDFLLTENILLRQSVDGGICRDEEGNVSLACRCGLVISGRTDPADPLFTIGGSCWTNDLRQLLATPSNTGQPLHPRNGCLHHGYASIALVPIRDMGRIVGLIQFNDRRKDCFRLDIVERLEEIASYLGAVLIRKRIEEEKLALQRQYQQALKLESLGVLAGGIAHDFNNILAIIIGYTNMIEMNCGTTEDNIGNIESAVERAAELCRQMLAYAGKAPLKEAQVELATFLDDTVNALKTGIPANVTINHDISTSIMSIKADASQLRQIVKNLVDNASQAIGEAPGEISVLLTDALISEAHTEKDCFGKPIPAESYLCLAVSDNGGGMDEDTKQRIFEPFFSTKFTGRGLGMSAVLGIVTAHKGALQLYTRLGQGTTFKVYLPIQLKRSPR